MELNLLQRRYLAKIRQNKGGWFARLTHTNLFSFYPDPLRRGLAIGLFWAFIPMPFQMLPATFFCLIGTANLPIALLCVWISNPLTYAPILYVESFIGEALHHSSIGDEIFGTIPNNVIALNVLYILTGGIIMGIISAIIGYVIGPFLSHQIQKISRQQKK